MLTATMLLLVEPNVWMVEAAIGRRRNLATKNKLNKNGSKEINSTSSLKSPVDELHQTFTLKSLKCDKMQQRKTINISLFKKKDVTK